MPVAPGAHPSSAPIPRVGKLFIGSAALGMAMIVAGVAGGNARLILMGAVVLAVMAVVAVIGHHVS
jgi:ABC-type proline/glycine betaine transport system permease subunit